LSRALWGASLAMLATHSQAGINTWTTNGPPGGIFHDVRASSSDANVFYATYGSSVHRSTDGGVHWTTLRDFASQANTLAVDPTDGNRLYVAVIDDGLFRSDDGGQSFVQVALPGSGMWGVGTNGATTYYAMQNQVYRSVDRGQSWSQATTTALAYTPSKFVVDPQNGDVLYSFSEPKAARSIDGGVTWSEAEINPGSTTTKIYDIARLSATQLIVAANDGLYVSNDRGDTWNRTASGSFLAVAVDPSTPGRAVATSRTTAPLLLTTDHGATWTTFGNLPVLRFEGASFAANTPSRIVILGQQGALYTNDNALNWTEAALSPAASHPTQFATTPAASSKVYTYTANTGGGLFATSGDTGWQRLNLAAAQALNPSAEFGEASLAVKPGAPDSIFFGVFNRGVFRSTDGGQSWTAPNTDLAGFAAKVFAFDPQDANTMYVSVSPASSAPAAGIYRSTDGGVTWSPHSTDLPSALLSTDLQIDPADPTRMFLGVSQGNEPGSPGGLYRSTDRGLTWVQSFNGRDVNSVAIDPSDSARMYVATENGLRVSNDGGSSFFSNTAFSAITNKSANNVVIDPVVPTTLYVASLDPYSPGMKESSWILRSVDAGDTWEVLRSAADAGGPWYVDRLALDPNHPTLLYAGTSLRGAATLEIAPDLHVEISDHSGSRPRGAESTFNVRAVNNGPYSATVVKLSTTLPAGLTNVSITADRGTCSMTTCTVPVLGVGEAVNAVVRYTTPTAALFLPVTATVTAHENDYVAGDNSARASAVAGDAGDLGITIAPSTSSVTQGSNVTYTVTVTNHGATSSAEGTLDFRLGSGFTLSTLPGGCSAATGGATCTLETLATGASRVFTFTAVATNAGSVEATANVIFGPTTADTNPADNVATSSVTATSAPSGGGNPSSGGHSGGGGGGAMNLATLLGGLLLLFFRRRSMRA
jgi:uncharacterized repeat protein (TIGR01451 family)